MPSVDDLVGPAALARLATPATLRLGREIADQGGVEIVGSSPLEIRAHVGRVASAAGRRTTKLALSGKELAWSCTCTSKADKFCKHCVALAIVTWEKSPTRRP